MYGLFGCAKKRWLGLAQERLTAQLFGSPRPAERIHAANLLSAQPAAQTGQ